MIRISSAWPHCCPPAGRSSDCACLKNIRDLSQDHFSQLHSWDKEIWSFISRIPFPQWQKGFFVFPLLSHLWTSQYFHLSSMFASLFCPVTQNQIMIKSFYVSFREQYTRIILEQENLGKVRVRLLPCTAIVQFVFLWGCGQSFIKSSVQPTKKIPSLLALVINTLEKDPAPSSGLDFLQGIAWAAVRDRQRAQCDSTFPENHLDKTLNRA